MNGMSNDQMTDSDAARPVVRPAVFYDGSCPLCQREIGFYQRRDGSEAVDWIDVSACAPGRDVASGLDREAAMARFHVRQPDGTLVSGAAGFAALWTHLPGFRLFGRIAQVPGVAHLLEGAYRVFLPIRPWLQRLARARAG